MIYKSNDRYKLLLGEVLEELKSIQDNSIDLIITSPPYNINLKNRKDTDTAHYDMCSDDMPWEDYVKWQVNVLNELYRVLKEGGSLFYNHKDKFKSENFYSPLEILFKSKFKIKQAIVWDRGGARSYNQGIFGDVYENIYWCFKGNSFKTSPSHNILGSIWRINREVNGAHPAPFPIELPLRIIYSLNEARGGVNYFGLF